MPATEPIESFASLEFASEPEAKPGRQASGDTEQVAVNRAIIRSCIEQMVAAAFSLDESLLRLPTRGRQNVARARQTAMYLAHTVCGLSLTETGEVFERDRTTVAHACAVIEDRREDPAFDRAVEMLERSTRIVHMHATVPRAPYGERGGA